MTVEILQGDCWEVMQGMADNIGSLYTWAENDFNQLSSDA